MYIYVCTLLFILRKDILLIKSRTFLANYFTDKLNFITFLSATFSRS